MEKRNWNILLAAVGLLVSAHYVQAVTMDWVTIGDAGNMFDNTNRGGVDYIYRISKYEVTNAQYREFLNAVTAFGDIYGLYNSNMNDIYGGITRSGSGIIGDPYVYSTTNGDPNWDNRPVGWVSWYDALRFANWLHNGQPTGVGQDGGCTEDGAYDMSSSPPVRKPGALVWIPDENEWYKAAYYKGGGTNAGYWDYATQSNIIPNNNLPTNDTGNSVNYYIYDYAVGGPYYSTDVGAYTLSGSAYGTFDQNGNAWEWSETLGKGTFYWIAGGGWGSNSSHLRACPGGFYSGPNDEKVWLGIRVASVPEPQTYYVDTDAVGNNNGSSWADAFNHLQDALAAAQSGDEIWVAQGTYIPDSNTTHPDGTGDREAKFQLKNGVAVRGGYAGYGDPDPNARDIDLYETILSGDLAGNDGPDNASNDENSYHVVTGSGTDETAVLEGLIITAGNDDRTYEPFPGFIEPIGKGGGMYNDSGSPTVTNCTFSGNWVGWRGGGMYNRLNSPTLNECTFNANSAYDGGGMVNHDSNPTLTNCTFSDNVGWVRGGGMYNAGGSSPTVTNCTFSNNWSSFRGGGMYSNLGCDPTVTNCKFMGNSTGVRGGGMFNGDYCSPIIINCAFVGNSAGTGGGMHNEEGSYSTIINCKFIANTSANEGGGLNNDEYSFPTLINCTFSNNSAGHWGGGGMYNVEDSISTLKNCIFWENSPDQIGLDHDGHAEALVTYSDIQGSWPGLGNIDVDPLFVDPCNNDYHLLPASPCIDTGDPCYVPEPNETDLDGNPRVINGRIDMGVYETDYLEVPMKFTPQALNLSSGGRLLKAHFVLPEGFSIEDVDANTPAVIEPYGIESYKIKVFLNDEGLVRVEATFDRSDLCSSITSYDDNIEVIVMGKLTSGQQFYGTDIIKITDRAFEHLALFVSYWLEGGCNEPDWCDGADLNADSVVNFIDFALLAPCCIEVINQ